MKILRHFFFLLRFWFLDEVEYNVIIIIIHHLSRLDSYMRLVMMLGLKTRVCDSSDTRPYITRRKTPVRGSCFLSDIQIWSWQIMSVW